MFKKLLIDNPHILCMNFLSKETALHLFMSTRHKEMTEVCIEKMEGWDHNFCLIIFSLLSQGGIPVTSTWIYFIFWFSTDIINLPVFMNFDYMTFHFRGTINFFTALDIRPDVLPELKLITGFVNYFFSFLHFLF